MDHQPKTDIQKMLESFEETDSIMKANKGLFIKDEIHSSWNLPLIKQAIGRCHRNHSSHVTLLSATDMRTTSDEISVLINLIKPQDKS